LALQGRLALLRYPLRRTAVDLCDSETRERCHTRNGVYVEQCVRTRRFIKIYNRHQRVASATPEQLVALVSDFDAIWPRSLAPPPRPREDGIYEVPPMIWREVARPGAIRAFQVIFPEELRAQHWFELQPLDSGTLIHHTIDGQAYGAGMAIWLDRIEPRHDLILAALLDNIAAAVA
jgi:hypothetical protein